jgi:hypothetical protein
MLLDSEEQADAVEVLEVRGALLFMRDAPGTPVMTTEEVMTLLRGDLPRRRVTYLVAR